MEERKLYNITQAAAKLGITTVTLYNRLKSGKVAEPGRDLLGRRKFTDEDINRILELSPPPAKKHQ